MILSENHLQILRHTIGIDYLQWYDKHRIDAEPYRNYFATSKETEDYAIIMELVSLGLMEGPSIKFDLEYFFVTEEGIAIARKSAHEYAKKSKPSRSKARYTAYLYSESDESFIEWLKNPYWEDYRKRYGVS